MRKFTTYTDRVLPVHYPRVVVETAVMHGAKRDELLENAELTPEMLTSPDMRVSYIQYSIVCSNALRLTNQPGLGLYVGLNTGIGQLGAAGFLIQNSPTMSAAFAVMQKYSAQIAPAWEFKIERGETLSSFTCTEAIPLHPREFAHEVVLTAWDHQTRGLNGGRPLPVRRVQLPFPEPSYVHLYRELLYDVPMSFNQDVARVEFDTEILDAPIPFADPATAKLAERLCLELMPAGASPEGLVAHVRRLLDTAPGVPPTLDELAVTLQTSARSLRRELRNMHTSYKELLDQSRRVRAEEWMKTNSMPLEGLATKLGFLHVRSFRRAFKRWTGRTPSAKHSDTH
jgi:AraC-like DNA-binding protein